MKATKISMVLFSIVIMGNSVAAQKATKLADCDDGRAYLNIRTNSVSEEKAEILGFNNPYGSYVSEVMPSGAAHDAGIQPFDYIYGLNDLRTSEAESLTDLLGYLRPGDKATVHLIRNGKPMAVNAVLGGNKTWKEDKKDAFLGINDEGEDEKEQPGVTVSVISNSAAEAMGMKDGDRILAIDGHPIVDWDDVTTAVPLTKPGQQIAVTIRRDGREQTLTGPVKSRSETYAYKTDKADKETSSQYNYRYEKDQNDGEYAFLGINSNSLTREKALKLGFENFYGSYVTSVIGGTAAEKAGILPFDYIYGIDEYRTGAEQALVDILYKYMPGDRATVHLVRQGKSRSLPVTFGRRSDAVERKRDQCDRPFLGIRATHEESTDTGVMVDIVENSTAEKMGLSDGDVILRINGFTIIDWEDITTAIDAMRVGDVVRINYLRNNQKAEAGETIKSYCDTKITNISEGTWNIKSPAIILRPSQPERLDVGNVKVVITDLSGKDAEELRRKFGLEVKSSQELELRNLKLAPNTNAGMFKLSFELPSHGQTVVKVFNSLGRLIYEYDLGAFQGNFSDNLDITQNGAGSYYLKVQQGARASARKIVLSKA